MIPFKKMVPLLCLFVLGSVFPPHSVAQTEKQPSTEVYPVMVKELERAGTADTAGQRIEVEGGRFAAISGDGIRAGEWEDKSNVLLWDSAAGEVEYAVTVPVGGFYNVYVEYADTNAYTETIERGLLINGAPAYAGNESFILGQRYRYDAYPFVKDAAGNEKRPKQLAVKEWLTEPVRDKSGMTSTPLKFPFEQGVNSVKLTGIRGSVAIARLIVRSPEPYPAYDEYASGQPPSTSPASFIQTVEGENPALVSSKGIQLFGISEAGVSPEAYGKRIYNAIGGLSWRHPGQWAEWEIETPEDGVYQLGIKYKQSDNNALSSFRIVEIDGHAPFREMLNVSFPFSASWAIKTLGDEEPYSFYLTKGKHRIRLSVTSEPYQEIHGALLQMADALNETDLEIKRITGISTDKQIDLFKRYDLKKYIPDLDQRLTGMAEEIEKQIAALSALTGSAKSGFDVLGTDAARLRSYAADLNDIPRSVDSLSRIQANVANFAASLAFQPLLVDYLTVKSTDERFPDAKAGMWKATSYFFKSFFASFTNDYDTKKGSKGSIEVWVQRNRDYVDLMQQYANEYFTPLTGYKVNINYIPGADVLVLANAAGKQPDVVTGASMDTPFNFALRNAVVKLNDFPEFAEISGRISPGTAIPFHYNGGDYALPEEATMSLMYYREDILNRNNIKVPQTWEEVKQIIPSLQQNNMNFWAPQGDWLTFFYQHGVDPYTADGADVGFDTPKGFAAFKYMTDLYVKYNLPQVITSFYQHFRQGDVPIGISGMSDYLLFRLAAPEISSKWKISPIPGTIDSTGTNVRWHGGDVRGVMMMKTDEQRQERAWEFVKWWMSTETQAQFANDLENNYGIEFRWYSANPEVVALTPWTPQDKEVVLEQLRWFKGVPFVPGGSYMTGRELTNAWTGTVIDKGHYREEMEQAVDSIRREIARYRREYGLSEGLR
ncbi:extracellular solute-binding protein [Paenibacillus spongiae]|uniref:Extracellular solute-binding protein n=1 Tax=Paenibacillus spongiae TaxID=2909671 RepID=A0ABY5S6I7_9BACL|nr:extracellular solute-binding protein [Paenibacillus spongiae]UVI29531.1 extracellular solute-binding protein [Paenibacillus spongiae]